MIEKLETVSIDTSKMNDENFIIDANHNLSNNNNNNNNNCFAHSHYVPTPMRVMTYNLWHNMPPEWVYRDRSERWKRYNERLRHFADIIIEEDPDVIALQEVRIDSSFVSMNNGDIPDWTNPSIHQKDMGSQIDHLLFHLHEAKLRFQINNPNKIQNQIKYYHSYDKSSSNDYYFAYQPAMNMFEMKKLVHRNEEGLLILSKYPIIDSDVLFLTRNLSDKSDDHQRIVLRVQIQIPIILNNSCDNQMKQTTTVDILTTHLSLSSIARDESIKDIIKFSSCINHNNHTSLIPSQLQILTGDFNAEPHELALEYLINSSNYYHINCSGFDDVINLSNNIDGNNYDEIKNQEEPFIDSWIYNKQHHNDHVESEGFTFPASKPIKRIDFIFARNRSNNNNNLNGHKLHMSIRNSRIVGNKPSSTTEYLVDSREGLGMLDLDSPIWASDHFGLVTDFEIS
eukprot:gene14002-18780_t